MDATPLTVLSDHLETLQVFLSWSDDMHLVILPLFFFVNFSHFFNLFFPGHITLRYLVDAIPLRVFYRSFCTMHTCSAWSVDVHVVLIYLPIIFINFFYFLYLFFSRSDYYQNRYLVGATPYRVFQRSF